MSVDLQNELEIAKSNIKGLTAQLDAAKQMINEILASNLQLRTNVVLFQQSYQEVNQEKHVLKQELEVQTNQVTYLTNKIPDLEALASNQEVPA
jgi:chromosome segregation ATPase